MLIRSLDENTIRLVTTTQIITSIYSAVKELAENAFDANAKNIEINLVDNGTSLIEVKDDGDGISKVDASYMALPSCTSKISNFADLGMLKTYGFRGEALNALCRISDVVIMTRTDKDEVGRLYNMDNNGNIMTSELYPRARGTTVQIKQMFKQLPVRRKLITNKKKANQDIKLIECLLKSFGICNYTVRISYKVNNNVIFIKPNLDSIKEAAEHVLGSKVICNMKWITYEETEATIQLMIPDKEIQDINEICQTNHYIFINNRPVKYKDIEKAVNDIISEYFSHKLSVKKKPIFLVHILMDPMDVDVNLEPNKDAVLLRNQQIILDAINRLLTNFYGIQREEQKKKNSDEISNYDQDYSLITNENISKTELPVYKRRKISPNMDEKEIKKTINRESVPQKFNKNTTELLKYQIIEDIPHCKNTLNDSISKDGKNNVSEGEIQVIANYLNTTSASHNSSIHNIDTNCTDRNQLKHDYTFSNNPIYTNDSLLYNLNSTDKKVNIHQTVNTLDNQIDISNENISQLPVVDLGEDFEFDFILNERSNVKTHINKIHDIQNNEKDNNLNVKEKNSLETWSKGHVEGLKGGTDVKPFIDCTNHISLSNNSYTIKTTFAKFANDIRSEIIKENPKLSAVEVARKITDIWKHLPSQEHGYYQDLVHEEKANKEKVKEEKIKQKLDEGVKKNKRRFLRMLENMKNLNTPKSENLAMRTTVPWDMNIEKVTKNFQNRCDYNNIHHVVGLISVNLWIIKNSAQLWLLDISHILKGLNSTDLILDKIQSQDVEKLFKQWILEKKNMSMIFPIYTLT
ncbi:PMS1 protein homolog 1-like isoform X1 [Vespa crabro]|uniref:PMS1 protein homolog 1-like isoform X1 n=1 Tax=Vespa crabro TaxID=7445 RepID=UPI001F028058|nr:PMS1 protein homolog 1-like isoform X1 [Vespa crabro]